MIDTLVAQALKIQGGEDGWVGFGLREYNKNKSQAVFLADGLIKLSKEGAIRWTVSKLKDFAQSTLGEWMIVLLKHPDTDSPRYYGGACNKYTLIIFRSGNEILRLSATCDNAEYNNNSPRLPVMDVFDVATRGAFRKPKTAHVCGLSGFGHSPDDVCPACEEYKA